MICNVGLHEVKLCSKLNMFPGYAIYDGQIKQKCKLNIAPAFRPGVK